MPPNAVTAHDRAVDAYRSEFDRQPTLIVRAPGRVNLIGEHTDYNDGFVLPLALPFDVVIAGEPRVDDRVIASSEGFEPIDFLLTDQTFQADGWMAYVSGMALLLTDESHDIAGWQACIASDIPAGASLSSSAALEMAAGLMFLAAAGSEIDSRNLARLGQRVENDLLGLPSGIMDQLASAMSVEGSASLIDCRDLSIDPVALPPDVDVVIMDTGTRRKLVHSEYAARRADCAAAVADIGVTALRDATLAQVAQLSDPVVRRRARHVVTENIRTLAAADAMRSNDSQELGLLMNASHTSLRDDFEVSGPALDRMVEVAQSTEGCLGARMTGGGFAGAAVALVHKHATASFVAELHSRYSAPSEQPSTAPVALYPVNPAEGASVTAAPTEPKTS